MLAPTCFFMSYVCSIVSDVDVDRRNDKEASDAA